LYDPEKSDRISGRDPQTGKQITYVEMTIYNALRKRSQRNHPGSSGKK